MAIGVFCGVVPFIFRRKPSSLKEEDTRKTMRLKLPSMLVSKRSKAANKGSEVRNSCGVKTPKIVTLRDLLDLSLCDGSESANEEEDTRKTMSSLEKASENGGIFWTGASNGQAVPARVTFDVLLPPSSISRLQSNVTEQASSVPPSPHILSPIIIESQIPTPPPQPEPQPDSSRESEEPAPSGNRVTPPPPPPVITSKPPKASNGAVPAPPPLKPTGKVTAPPPPPMPMRKRTMAAPAPPPPPVFAGAKNLRLKKAATKLKRSSEMENLYRSLKGKVEGSSLDDKPKGGKGTFNNASKGGKPEMDDVLAEMTKRSPYFRQIEEDVKNHAKTIMEMKKAIASFHTSDMSELIRFHNYVESHLEKLTDESKVLARFEDFPCKKLEALKMAATLYSKLNSIVSTLQNWQPASPVGQHLARAERYFNKIKEDMGTLEKTKDEESKKFKTHKIQFDFSALVRIKELMVDVSSNCMELALKEKSKKESAQQLWKAFQFAFRVYTFAGGQDERAEKLTKELAEEIETDLHR